MEPTTYIIWMIGENPAPVACAAADVESAVRHTVAEWRKHGLAMETVDVGAVEMSGTALHTFTIVNGHGPN